MQTTTHKIPFFFDGAFGTYYNLLNPQDDYCELANITDPDTVYKIHKEYLLAGVNAIKTNTFGVNSLMTSDNYEAEDILRNGYQLALRATEGTDAVVFADIGYIHSDDDEISKEYIRIAQTFISCGAKYFLFETCAEYDILRPAIDYIKTVVPDAYIIVSFAVSQDGYTLKGHYYKDLIQQATSNPYIGATGLNCICGPSHLFSLIKEIDLSGLHFIAMPNAGYPSTINGRTVYQDNAEYFANRLVNIYNLGVNIIGGCCGTTPEHIRLTIEKISGAYPNTSITTSYSSPKSPPTTSTNVFESYLNSGKKVIAVELDPPIDTDCDYIITAAKKLRLAGADIITVADSPLARTRADSIMIAAKIKREVGIEVLPHLSCRDKNHISIKGSLMGANIEGISSVLAITGDPVAPTDRGNYKGVFSMNSYNLISFINSLNTEVFTQSPFYIGGALNISMPQFEPELKRAKRKIENGASFLLTQPLFSDESIENLYTARQNLDCKILAGILPFASYRNALFLNNEVTGIDIPDDLLQELKDKTPEEVIPLSIKFSTGIIHKAYEACDGFYLMTPLKKTDLICSLIEQIREIEQTEIQTNEYIG